MRKKWFSLGCLTSFLLLMLFLFFLGRAIGKLINQNKSKKRILPNSTLYLQLKGNIPEYSILKDSMFGEKIITVNDIITAIKNAKTNPDISNIFIEPQFLSMGYSSLNDIVEAIKDFKTSNKPVYSYLEMASTKDYFVASVADKVYLNPSYSAGILLKGIGINGHFYKNLLDKIGIDINVIHAGKYKGFGENYSRTNFSEPVKKNIDLLLGEVYDNILKDISNNRNIPIKELKKIFEDRDKLFINGEIALKTKIVDELKQKQDIFEELGITENYIVKPSNLNKEKFNTANGKIAVVFAEGPIVSSLQRQNPKNMVITSKKYVKILKKLQNDKSIKAVVIRVNSPGGSALESEIILNAIKKLKTVKPVIVSMGSVAASGGYYISCNADYIFAEKYTVTGSIGVVAMLPKAKKLADKIGITTDKIHKGNYVGLFDIFSDYDKNTISMIKKSITDTYWEFKTRVSEGRNIPVTKVEDLAQGQVWSAKKALELKLINKIGNLDDAIKYAADLVKLTNWKTINYPEKKSFLDYLLENNFKFNIASRIYKNEIVKDLRINKAYQYFDMIRQDPIQMLYLGELN